ncbi:MAG: xanthine dehydrogenase family protein molybdopterin-binding subunit [Pseudomonadota bacterium]
MAQFGIGQAVPRTEDPTLVTGRGQYTDDLFFPDQSYAYFLRSPHAHARITAQDTTKARAMDGVIAVLTAKDLKDLGTLPCRGQVTNRDGSKQKTVPRTILAGDIVRYVGDPVALVVAQTPHLARDGAEAIETEYEPLDAVVQTGKALGAHQKVWDTLTENTYFDWATGDEAATDQAFAKAAHTVRVDLVNNRLSANPMETRACIATFAPDGTPIFYVGSQGVHLMQDLLMDILRLDKLTVRTGDVGGGFGMKMFIYPEYVACLFAARKLGRTVRWMADRNESFLSDNHSRDHLTTIELALDEQGHFLGLRADTIANLGAYLSLFSPFVATWGNNMLSGLYNINAIYARVRGVATHTQPIDAYRGAGRPEAAYAIERVVDAAARQLNITPDALRRRNFIKNFPKKTATGLTYDSGSFAAHMETAMTQARWDSFTQRRAAAALKGKRRGIAMATYIEACAAGDPETAEVTLDDAHHATIKIGTQNNGQGHATAYAQMVAEHLPIELGNITLIQGDTDLVKTGGGTGGSRSLPVGGVCVKRASLKIQDKMRALAGEMLEADVTDIAYEDGQFTVLGTDRAVAFADVVRKAQQGGTRLNAEDTFKPPHATFPNGTHICEVEIDPDTGALSIKGYTVVDDFGRVLNPLLLAGQVHGGVGQGIGQALCEEVRYDVDSGQLLTGSFMDYAMPRASDLPLITFDYQEDTPCQTNPMGVKGAGEAGAIGAPPALINAIIDALAQDGVTHIDMPTTPQRIWRAIHASGD